MKGNSGMIYRMGEEFTITGMEAGMKGNTRMASQQAKAENSIHQAIS